MKKEVDLKTKIRQLNIKITHHSENALSLNQNIKPKENDKFEEENVNKSPANFCYLSLKILNLY